MPASPNGAAARETVIPTETGYIPDLAGRILGRRGGFGAVRVLRLCRWQFSLNLSCADKLRSWEPGLFIHSIGTVRFRFRSR